MGRRHRWETERITPFEQAWLSQFTLRLPRPSAFELTEALLPPYVSAEGGKLLRSAYAAFRFRWRIRDPPPEFKFGVHFRDHL